LEQGLDRTIAYFSDILGHSSKPRPPRGRPVAYGRNAVEKQREPDADTMRELAVVPSLSE
jgi:hypothetical protein